LAGQSHAIGPPEKPGLLAIDPDKTTIAIALPT